MKFKLSHLLLCLFVVTPFLAVPVEARTLVFTYTTPSFIAFYNAHPVKFTVTRDGQTKGTVSVVGLNNTVTLTLHDDGHSFIRPYFLNIYVAPFRGQQLPYPTFFASPGPGVVTIKVDNEAPNEVLMIIGENFDTGPMAFGLIF
jgi:hypothetical protein